MANVIKLKRGSGSDPSASDLVVGEVAIRTDSGKLFTKKDNGTIAEISGSGGGSDIFINTLSSSSGSGGGSATFNGTATRFTLSNPPSVSAQQLLVSINGVIQKPNSGTSPSEGFAIDGNDIIFAAAPATGSDFFIVTYGSLNIAVPADNSVTSAKIVDGTIVGTDLATNVDLVDNQKIRFGTGNDLEIYHDGTHSRLNSATGMFNIQSDDFRVTDAANSLTAFKIDPDGATDLRYNGSVKLQTTSYGVRFVDLIKLDNPTTAGRDVTWNHAADELRWEDNTKASFGIGSDLQIYHDGTNSYLQNGTGSLLVQGGSQILYLQAVNHEDGLRVNPNGSVQLFFDGGGAKFETTSGGVKATGNIQLTENVYLDDSKKLLIGNAQDLQIFHDGSHNRIQNAVANQNIYIEGYPNEPSTPFIYLNPRRNITGLSVKANQGVDLYYDGSKKFETTSTGVKVSGTNLNMNSAYIDFSGSISTPSTAAAIFRPADNTLAFSTANTRRMTIDGSGRVMIGVNDTSHASGNADDLCVGNNDSSAEHGITIGSNNAGSIRFSDSAHGSIGIINYDHGLDQLAFYTHAAVRITVQSSGAAFSVPIQLGSGNSHNSAKLVIQGSGNTSGTNSVFVKNSDETPLFQVRNDGAFFTGTDGTSPHNLGTSTNANVVVTSDGVLRRHTSSLRYKKDIADATWGLADVLNLKAKTFKNNNTGEFADDKTYAGFIAEDIHALGLTEFVEYNDANEPDALNYASMVALMAKAIQDLNAKVEALEAN